MAQRTLDAETLSCSICLDLLKDPVTLPCGHSYCGSCVQSSCDEEDGEKLHSCPECRWTVTPGLVPGKNNTLAALVEQLKKTGLQAAPADPCYAGAESVAGDSCAGRKPTHSEAEDHLQPHYESAASEGHKLVDPAEELQETACSGHGEVVKTSCAPDDHKGHDAASAAAEGSEKQEEPEGSRRAIQQRVQDGEEDAGALQQELKAVEVSADTAVEDGEKSLTETIRLVENGSPDAQQQIGSLQESGAAQVGELQEKLEQEITELKQPSHTEDLSRFLRNSPSRLGESPDSSSTHVRPGRSFEELTAALSETREKLQDPPREVWTNISPAPAEADVSPSEPRTRAGFLKYSRRITLDPNTANPRLLLSEGNRKATGLRESQACPPHPDRFSKFRQVLSREGLTGRCYWEVDWSGEGVYVAAAYGNVGRSGPESRFGYNDKSWALDCHNGGYKFRFNGVPSDLPGPPSSRVGVYLDHGAGVLSFYSVSDTMTLLHRVRTTFAGPLHAGVWLYCYFDVGGSAEFVSPAREDGV